MTLYSGNGILDFKIIKIFTNVKKTYVKLS